MFLYLDSLSRENYYQGFYGALENIFILQHLFTRFGIYSALLFPIFIRFTTRYLFSFLRYTFLIDKRTLTNADDGKWTCLYTYSRTDCKLWCLLLNFRSRCAPHSATTSHADEFTFLPRFANCCEINNSVLLLWYHNLSRSARLITT